MGAATGPPERASAAPIHPGAVTVPTAGVPSDNTTLVDVLAALRAEGYTESFTAGDDGELTCSGCGRAFAPERATVERFRRMEGASDPSDELMVAGGTCPECRRLGVAVLGFGPSASPADAAVVARLPLAPD